MILLFPVLLLLFLVFGLWLAHKGGRWAYKKYHHILAYIGGFALVLVLVFGDEVFGHYYWQHLCKAESGLHVYKKVPVEGFLYNGGPFDKPYAKEFLDRGYQYIEGIEEKGYDYKTGRGQVYRYELNNNKEITNLPIDELRSRYVYTNETVQYPHFVWGYDHAIKDVQTKELIGVQSLIGYRGSVVIKFLRHLTGAEFEGSAAYCGHGVFGSSVIRATIPPIKLKNGVNHE